MLLPSTPQRGLECIIITMCRVVATWLYPSVIPFENCTELCRHQRGRRILCDLLLCHSQASEIPCPSESSVTAADTKVSLTVTTAETPQLDASSTAPALQVDNTDTEDLPIWYTVYTVPTFSILSQDQNFTPQQVNFGNTLAYEVYHECRWLHHARVQDFLPLKTLLAFGGQGQKLRTTYICPVRNVIEKRWYFCVLGEPGFHLFRSEGKRVGNKLITFTAVDDDELSPREYCQAKFLEFIQGLPDQTWKSGSGGQLDDVGMPRSPEVCKEHDAERLKGTTNSSGRRRSLRKPKPRKRDVPSMTTPRRSKV